MGLLTETGLISIITMAFAFFTACLGVLYKSKCSNVKFCGVSINRNIEAEVREDLAAIEGKNENAV